MRVERSQGTRDLLPSLGAFLGIHLHLGFGGGLESLRETPFEMLFYTNKKVKAF